MKTILLPVDFNDSTPKLVAYAVAFAQEINAKLHVLHVASLDVGFVIGDLGFQYLPELEQTELKRESQELQSIQKQIDDAQVPNEILLEQGTASEVIVEKAQAIEADFILIGMHSKGFLMEAILGSVAQEVLKKSKTPTLVFPFNKN